jgi:hypothetical protein
MEGSGWSIERLKRVGKAAAGAEIRREEDETQVAYENGLNEKHGERERGVMHQQGISRDLPPI